MQFATISFAEALLHEHLRTPNLLKELRNKDYLLVPDYDQAGKGMRLTGQLVIELVEEVQKIKSFSFEEASDWIFEQNAVFTRSWVVNNTYEGILNYITRDKTRFEKRLNILKGENWFKALSVLRNNVSHFDNHGKVLTWNFPEDVIRWETLEFKRGEPAADLKYTDMEVIALIESAAQYLKDNKSILE